MCSRPNFATEPGAASEYRTRSGRCTPAWGRSGRTWTVLSLAICYNSEICEPPGAILPRSFSASFRRGPKQGVDLGGNGFRNGCHHVESRVVQAELELRDIALPHPGKLFHL